MLAEAALSLVCLESLVDGASRRGFGSIYSDRRRTPAETVGLMRPLMPEFGITRLACVTGLDHIGIPVWSAIRPNSRTLAQSQGKGLDDAAAQASALMEAVEVATAERTDFPVVRATRRELANAGLAVDSIDHLLRSGSRPIIDDEPIDWLEGHDLVAERAVMVPHGAVTFADARLRSRYWQTSDGLASGNTLWEAVLHGLCERIERDAMTLWLLRPDDEVMSRCVDAASFRDPALNSLCDAIACAGLQLRLFDASCDTNTPVFTAFISDPADGFEDRWKYFDLSSGSGCHPLPVLAAIRAVTEAAQTRLTTISAARDDFDPRRYFERLDPSLLVYPRSTPQLRPELARPVAPDRGGYLRGLITRLTAVGVDSVILVPFERGERGFAVARILVPALENPSGDRAARFGPRAMAFVEARS